MMEGGELGLVMAATGVAMGIYSLFVASRPRQVVLVADVRPVERLVTVVTPAGLQDDEAATLKKHAENVKRLGLDRTPTSGVRVYGNFKGRNGR